MLNTRRKHLSKRSTLGEISAILAGMGTVLEIFPARKPRRRRLRPQDYQGVSVCDLKDLEKIRSDWQKVGYSLQKAKEKVISEHAKSLR